MINLSRHTEWLSLVEVSGPFLAVSVLDKAFPQGLDVVETPRRQHLRAAYEEWCDAMDEDDPLLPDLHREWIRLVFREILEYDDVTLKMDDVAVGLYTVASPERTDIFKADWVVLSPADGKPRLFVSIQPPGTDLEKVKKGDNWPTSLRERMAVLCREHNIRLGLVTDGDRWMLVNAPSGATSSDASWYARLWFQEPITLKAFQSLLGIRRCFGPADETLEVLLEKSLEHHEEVTDTLGEQVRRAVEVLVQCLDKADADRNRELLRDVSPSELYEAGLTVMMRLVFVLCAEERGLMLSGDPVYDECYAVSTLRAQLAEEADRHGPEVLERRHDAWARLLAVFRAVHGGIDHDSLRMPALGGSLFDPDRFPFFEGRGKGTSWRDSSAIPLPIDNRTVLLLLNSLQLLEQHGGALLLSYRALDVEQIGHVYEGLLEYTVTRVPSVTVGQVGAGKAKNPNLLLSELESARMDGEDSLVALLRETTKRSESAIRRSLGRPIEDDMFGRLLSVCGGDTTLAERIRPFANLLRADAWDEPIVYRKDAFMVTLGADRRETGTHYTPKSLTERIVKTTLEPVVYVGPIEGKPREEWRLKSSAELLDLKVCDPAMGSGAFLVQACRWLAERLVETWAVEETAGRFVTADGDVQEDAGEADPMPVALDERLLSAKRLIAERCLYGVDVNPLAVELAKLSIWLVTLAKGRPFGFLDHNLRHGDSLLGIHRLDQLTKLKMDPDDGPYQQRIFGQNVADVVGEAIEIRKRLRAVPIRDIRDVETMACLDKDVREKLESVELVADVMIGEALCSNGNTRTLNSILDSLSSGAGDFLNGNEKMGETIAREARKTLSVDLPNDKPPRKPFHWPLEFPEVFARENGGFDAMMGNPPFIGGRRMRGAIGDAMMTWLTLSWPHSSMNADYCTFFYLRAVLLLKSGGGFGFLATKTIGQGDTARTGLSHLVDKMGCTIRHALSSFVWPGTASVVAALVVGQKGNWSGVKTLDQRKVEFISPVLDDQRGWGEALRLPGNIPRSFQGSVLVGMGFVLTPEEARNYIDSKEANRLVIKPYLSGDDLNSHPEQKASRWAIDFRDFPLEHCEQRWPELIKRIRQLVKPERDLKRREAHRKYWWHHGDKRPALYDCIRGRLEVFAVAAVTKYVSIVSVPAEQVFMNKVYVLDLPSWASFSALQCTFHDVWVRRGSSSMGETLNYTPSDYFDTYPFLHLNNTELQLIGERYHSFRRTIMLDNNEGLTDMYNRFHNPEVSAESICQLRQLHADMDRAVALAYEWRDFDPQHGFHKTKQGMRFTISENARNEVLRRLLELNHKLYDEEIRLGIHFKKSKNFSTTGRGRGKKGKR